MWGSFGLDLCNSIFAQDLLDLRSLIDNIVPNSYEQDSL